MFNLETAISTWLSQFSHRDAYTPPDVKEIERHIRDHVKVLIEYGLGPEEAFRAATRDFGGFDSSDDEYGKVYWAKAGSGSPFANKLRAHLSLIKHYLVSSTRALKSNAGFSSINIVGLAIGLAASFLIFIFVTHEYSYDLFHEDGDRLHRLLLETNQGPMRPRTQFVLPPIAHAEIPGVDAYVRISNDQSMFIGVGNESFPERGYFSVDSTFFEVFDYDLISGDLESALDAPDGIVVTESLARKYFGSIDVIGERLVINQNSERTITAVAADPPSNSHLQFTMLDPIPNFVANWGSSLTNWSTREIHTYFRLTPGVSPSTIESGLNELALRHGGDQLPTPPSYRLQRLENIHLHSSGFGRDIQPQGDIQYVRLFAAIALLILLIAAVNYVNLATARSLGRSRETGLRKVVGATRSQLISQYLGESVLVSGAALVIAVAFVMLTMPSLNDLTQSSFSGASTGLKWLVLLAASLFVGLAAGIYPALLQSRYEPAIVLKRLHLGSSKSMLRSVLVIFQFGVTTILIIGSVMLFRQLQFIRSADLGFEPENTLVVLVPGSLIGGYDAYRAAISGHPGVIDVTASSNIPPESWGTPTFTPSGSDTTFSAKLYSVDFNFMDVMEMETVAGRNFSSVFGADSMSSFIINEAAVLAMGSTPEGVIGREANLGWVGRDGTIVGVVKDFHFRSMRSQIAPVVMTVAPGFFWKVIVKVHPRNTEQVLSHLKDAWEAHAPGWTFNYTFLDDSISADYGADHRFGRLIGWLTGLSIFLACIGLFGLVSFSTKQRTKEIGVRKVLGASTTGLLGLLSREYAKLLLIAFLLAMPLAWWFAQSWLPGFAYAVQMDAWAFLTSALIVTLVAALSITSQTIRAAMGRPVESLKYE